MITFYNYCSAGDGYKTFFRPVSHNSWNDNWQFGRISENIMISLKRHKKVLMVLWHGTKGLKCLWHWLHNYQADVQAWNTFHKGINTLRLRQNGRHFADDIFKCIFLNENVWISIKISLKFVPWNHINNIPALVQKMAWRRPGDKPLSEPMMVSLLMHICVTRPQWVKSSYLVKIHYFKNDHFISIQFCICHFS